jgi:hypothetical protein
MKAPVRLLAVSMLAFPFSRRTDDKPQLSGIEIINKHLEAVGGKDALTKIRSRVALGIAKKEGDAAVPVAIMSEAPNRVSAIYQFQGFNWQLTYDGAKTIFKPAISRAVKAHSALFRR